MRCPLASSRQPRDSESGCPGAGVRIGGRVGVGDGVGTGEGMKVAAVVGVGVGDGNGVVLGGGLGVVDEVRVAVLVVGEVGAADATCETGSSPGCPHDVRLDAVQSSARSTSTAERRIGNLPLQDDVKEIAE